MDADGDDKNVPLDVIQWLFHISLVIVAAVAVAEEKDGSP